MRRVGDPVRALLRTRHVVVVFAAAAALLAAPAQGLAASGDAETESPIGLSIKPADREFEAGETVDLNVTATNNATDECSLLGAPDGTLKIDSVTRDGEPIKPEITRASLIQSFDSRFETDLQPVAPGESVDYRIAAARGSTSDAQTLDILTPLPRGGAVLSSWDVTEPGEYKVTARYTMPTLPFTDSGPCTGSSAPSSASFSVLASEDEDGWFGSTWFWILLIALVLLIVLALYRRRHAAAGQISLLLALAIVSGLMTQHPAPAEAATVEGCFNSFEKKGGDPAHILPAIGVKGENINIVLMPSGHSYANPTKQPPEVHWNPKDAFKLPDGVFANDCATLYHELVHVSEGINGTTGSAECGNSGVPITEVYATRYENRYRKSHGLPQRTTHGERDSAGKLVPIPKLKDCENEKQKQARKDGRCKDVPVGGCSRDDSNPPPPGRAPAGPGAGAPGGAGGTGGAPGGAGTGGAGSGAGGAASGPGSTGDPHLLTHDYLAYDMQAAGELVLVRSDDGDFELQTRQQAYMKSKTVAVNTAVAVRVGDTRLGFYLDDGRGIAVHQDGQEAQLEEGTTELGDVSVTRRPSSNPFEPDGYTVALSDGTTIDIDREGPYGMRTYVRLAEEREGAVGGLLGDFDGDPENDLVPAGGDAPVDSEDFGAVHGEFADSWRVSEETSLFDYGEGESTETFTDRSFPQEPTTVDSLPGGTREMAEELCTELDVADPVLLEDCILDVATTGQADFGVSAHTSQQALDAANLAAAGAETASGEEDAVGGSSSGQDGDLAPGDTIDGTIDEEGEQVVYSFSAKEGDVAYFQSGTECAKDSDENIGWFVKKAGDIDANGGELGLGVICDDIGRVRFLEDGDYVLVVESTFAGALGDYSFTWVPVVSDETVPLEIGEETAGEVKLGELDLFEFDAQKGDQLTYEPAPDCDTDGGTITWKVVAASDVYASITSAAYPPVAEGFACDEGSLEFDHDDTYVVAFQGNATFDAVGPYAFSLED